MINVVSLYDESGNMLRPWAEVGFNCYCIDILNDMRSEKVGAGWLHFVKADMNDPQTLLNVLALKPRFVSSFPPCTDLAVLGAAHFATKLAANPNYRKEAMSLVYAARDIGEASNCPYFIENPVSVISTEWRKPDYIFNPFEYGGYLPEDDIHPRWPEYIKPRDAYPKKTCLWVGGGFIMPEKKPVEVAAGYSLQHKKLGGKSAKTKQIRSETPRGFSKAVFETHARKAWNGV